MRAGWRVRAAVALAGEVVSERARQVTKWGQQDHPDACPTLLGRPVVSHQRLAEGVEIPTADRAKFITETAARQGRLHWSAILVEEVAEAVDAIGHDAELRAELIQVAAVALAWVEAIDRRQTP